MPDIIVIGGGPAGLMAAFTAAGRGLSTTIVERNQGLPKKLLITGKGRCNLTNDTDLEGVLTNLCRGARFMQSSLRAFSPRDIMDFFSSRGLPLKTERGGRVFPVSDRAADVAECLVAAAREAGVKFVAGRAECVLTDENGVCGVKLSDSRKLDCRAAIIATGGLSYPLTGSTGDGYRMARALGHRVTDTHPALVPINCLDPFCRDLSGLTLKNVELIALCGGRELFRERGEMLFAAFGITGPLVLTLSSALGGQLPAGMELKIDLKPALDPKTLDRRLLRDFSEAPNRELKNSLGDLLPAALAPVVIEAAKIEPKRRINALTAAERARLLAVLKGLPLHPAGLRPIAEAVVTAGGVALDQLVPRSMASKLTPGLYFAGEILDVDGYTGGYNLTVALASGRAAGSWALRDRPGRNG